MIFPAAFTNSTPLVTSSSTEAKVVVENGRRHYTEADIFSNGYDVRYAELEQSRKHRRSGRLTIETKLLS